MRREERTPQRRREGDSQYLQIAQGSEGSIFDAADVVAVQLPADERQKSAAGLQTSGWGLRGGREEEERWGLREGGRHTHTRASHIYSALLTAVGIKDQLAKSGLSGYNLLLSRPLSLSPHC